MSDDWHSGACIAGGVATQVHGINDGVSSSLGDFATKVTKIPFLS